MTGVADERISDRERERVVELLHHHTAQGRLSLDEFAERAGQVYSARTQAALAEVMGDLPTDRAPALPDTTPSSRRIRKIAAFMGRAEARGPWQASEPIKALAFWGHAVVDLRNALIETPVIDIKAKAIMGAVEVIVPPGIPVEMDGVVIMGGSTSRIRTQDLLPGAPRVRIQVKGLWGSVVARNPRSRRVRDQLRQAHKMHHAHYKRHSDSDALPEGRIPSGTLTIMVSDINGSTQIAEQLGDQHWVKVLEAHNRIVRKHVATNDGTEVKAQGDGFLTVFPSARSAILAAMAIQRGMAEYRLKHPDVPLSVALGMHTGEVVTTADDVLGSNVTIASRLADAAGPGDILVSSLTRDLTASASDLHFDDGTELTLKGVSTPWRAYGVSWR